MWYRSAGGATQSLPPTGQHCQTEQITVSVRRSRFPGLEKDIRDDHHLLPSGRAHPRRRGPDVQPVLDCIPTVRCSMCGGSSGFAGEGTVVVLTITELHHQRWQTSQGYGMRGRCQPQRFLQTHDQSKSLQGCLHIPPVQVNHTLL